MTFFHVFIITGIFYYKLYKIPLKIVLWFYYEYRLKNMYHYVEYIFHGKIYNTKTKGVLNDIEGAGLINEINNRGGKVLIHKEGTENEIWNYIDYVEAKENEIKEQDLLITSTK